MEWNLTQDEWDVAVFLLIASAGDILLLEVARANVSLGFRVDSCDSGLRSLISGEDVHSTFIQNERVTRVRFHSKRCRESANQGESAWMIYLRIHRGHHFDAEIRKTTERVYHRVEIKTRKETRDRHVRCTLTGRACTE